jgi:hypothetical protein
MARGRTSRASRALAVLSAGTALVAVHAQSNVTSATLGQLAGGTGSDG